MPDYSFRRLFSPAQSSNRNKRLSRDQDAVNSSFVLVATPEKAPETLAVQSIGLMESEDPEFTPDLDREMSYDGFSEPPLLTSESRMSSTKPHLTLNVSKGSSIITTPKRTTSLVKSKFRTSLLTSDPVKAGPQNSYSAVVSAGRRHPSPAPSPPSRFSTSPSAQHGKGLEGSPSDLCRTPSLSSSHSSTLSSLTSGSSSPDAQSKKITNETQSQVLYKPSIQRRTSFFSRNHHVRESLNRSSESLDRVLLPTIILTLPDDESSYFTQSPFPMTLFMAYGPETSGDYNRLRVPVAPIGAFSSTKRRQWAHPAGPWLRESRGLELKSSPPKGARLSGGNIVGWGSVRPWLPRLRILIEAHQPIQFPPPRLPNERDLERRRQQRVRTTARSYFPVSFNAISWGHWGLMVTSGFWKPSVLKQEDLGTWYTWHLFKRLFPKKHCLIWSLTLFAPSVSSSDSDMWSQWKTSSKGKNPRSYLVACQIK